MGSLDGAQRNPGLHRSEQLQACITLQQACPECTEGLRAIGCYSVAGFKIRHLCVLCVSTREKTNKLSPRRKARKGISGKNEINIEVLGDLGAFAREKVINHLGGVDFHHTKSGNNS
jgi:hypothetical protein